MITKTIFHYSDAHIYTSVRYTVEEGAEVCSLAVWQLTLLDTK
jgi:hypothetical protein